MTDEQEIAELKRLIEKYGLVGAAEAAYKVGIMTQNINANPGFPKEVAKLRSTRVWIEAEIEEFATEYRARKTGGKRSDKANA